MNDCKQRSTLSPRLNRRLLLSLIFISSLLGILLALGACNAAVPSVPPTVTPAEVIPATPTHTPVPPPTLTPVVPRVILFAPPGHDKDMADKLEVVLTDLAKSEGLTFETVTSLSSADLQQGVKLVVTLTPDPEITQLAVDSPETQFLAIGNLDLEAGGNISTINSTGSGPDQTGFAAGYLAAVITEDWRVGVLSEQDSPEGNTAQLGYTNGVVYFCGLCRPVYPPFPIPGYPLAYQLADTSGETEWQTALGNLQTWNVGTVFVDPEIASEGLYQVIADAGMNMIGTGEPPSGLKDHWVASIGAVDLIEAVNNLWSDLIAGNGGAQVNLPITLQSVNPDLVSPGRQALVEEMLEELSQGYIDTGVDSGSGEPGN